VEDFFIDFSLYGYILVGIMSVSLLIQLIYYLLVFLRVPLFSGAKLQYAETKGPVSVIICAKNEEENLAQHLPLILEQDYPEFEVIVVNDCSDDDSQQVLENMQEKYSHLRVTQIKHDEKFTHGKKLALTIGIKAAKNEWLLMTDADCKPKTNQWIATMQRNFVPDSQIVLGYGGYNPEKGFLNKMIRYDCMMIALQYFSFALIKMPYMGVGRNLAYRKSLFMNNKGFASHSHLKSGDDDLFINEVANGKNTRVELSINSLTSSIPKKSFEKWAFQKGRHLTTGSYYKFKHKFLLGTELFSRFLFYLSVILLIVSPVTWDIGLVAFGFRIVLQLFILNAAMNKLNEKKLLAFSIILDFILPLMYLFMYFSNSINTKQHKWK
jgi:poly-beta-1,6-N-acetyl-D-glucosamine synthase